MMSSIGRLAESQKVFEHGLVDFVFFLWFLSPQVALWDKIDWEWQDGFGGPRAGIQAQVILLQQHWAGRLERVDFL